MSYNQTKCLLGALAALVISDGLITQLLVRNDLGREMNPFLATLVGEWNFLIIKVLGAFLCALILWDIHSKWRKLGNIAIISCVVAYTGVVLWNLSIFLVSLV